MSEETSTVKNITQKVFGAEENSAATLGKEKLNKYNSLAVNMFNTSVLITKERMAPGLAALADKLFFGINVYTTLYYVNVLKIDMVYVTIILTLIGIYDMLNNPLMGIVYDRTRTRWGKARPYLLLGILPYYLSTTMLYSGAIIFGDKPGNDPSKIIFVFTMLFIKETFSTIYTIPRGNLITLMSPNPKDRINVGLIQSYVGEVGAQFIYVIFVPLMEMANKGVLNFSLAYVYMGLAVFAGITGVIADTNMIIQCQERILMQPKPANSGKALFYMLKNKYAMRNFITSLCFNWWSNGGYSWNVVMQQEIFGGTVGTFFAIGPYTALDFLSLTFVPKFQKLFKNNNRKALIWLRIWDALAAFILFGLGTPFLKNKWIIVAIYAILHGLQGVNNAPAKVFEAEIEREITDYTEYVTGERPDGSFYLLANLIGKVTAPLNAAFTIFMFKWSGYDPTITMLPWSQGNIHVYRKVFFLDACGYVIPNLFLMIPYFFYDLEGKKREDMYIALNERRALIAKETNEELEMLVKAVEEMKESE